MEAVPSGGWRTRWSDGLTYIGDRLNNHVSIYHVYDSYIYELYLNESFESSEPRTRTRLFESLWTWHWPASIGNRYTFVLFFILCFYFCSSLLYTWCQCVSIESAGFLATPIHPGTSFFAQFAIPKASLIDRAILSATFSFYQFGNVCSSSCLRICL